MKYKQYEGVWFKIRPSFTTKNNNYCEFFYKERELFSFIDHLKKSDCIEISDWFNKKSTLIEKIEVNKNISAELLITYFGCKIQRVIYLGGVNLGLLKALIESHEI